MNQLPAPQPQPESRSRHRNSQPKGEERYELRAPELSQRRGKGLYAARQQVVATVIGEIKPGGTYIATQAPGLSVDAAFATIRMLDRLGNRFTPGVNFIVVPSGFGLADLTQFATGQAPPVLKPEYKIPSTMSPLRGKLTGRGGPRND